MTRKPASWGWGRALALEEWVWVRAAFPVLLVSLVGLSELYPGFIQLLAVASMPAHYLCRNIITQGLFSKDTVTP